MTIGGANKIPALQHTYVTDASLAVAAALAGFAATQRQRQHRGVTRRETGRRGDKKGNGQEG